MRFLELFIIKRETMQRFFFYTINHGNHRKFFVIDGKASNMCGGFNIGEEYLGQVTGLNPFGTIICGLQVKVHKKSRNDF
jgi:phosphatidylserine/phosphatidylglycerophosphate/cardiolipin synthase-like enzyme